MTSEEFKFWIKGFLELTNDNFLDRHQLAIIKNHAKLVETVMGCRDENIDDFINILDKKMASKNRILLSIINNAIDKQL